MEQLHQTEKRWQTVRDWIIKQIQVGKWENEIQLPSIRTLARLFQTSITTVQRALADLEASAYVFSVPRVGYFVSQGCQKDVEHQLDFSAVDVNVNHAVVKMLSEAALPDSLSLSSAVLHSDLTPRAWLNKSLISCAAKSGDMLAGFVAPPGLPALRRRIASLMLLRGVTCGPDDILITSGDSIAMELALEAIAGSGATIAIETPTYYGILQIIERLGMRALPLRTDPQDGIDINHLAEALKQTTISAIFLNPTLQNPRGFIMPNAARERISRLAEEAQVPLIEDDIFFDLVPVPHRPRAIKSFNVGDQTIYCSSFSKTIAPGYRVGWCVPGKYRESILAQMYARNLSVSSLGQNVINEFIARGYLDEHCHRLHTQLAAVGSMLEGIVRNDFPAGTRYQPPVGGFIHWIEFPATTNMRALIEKARQQGCHVSGNGIFYPDGVATQALRICTGNSLSVELARAIRQLAVCSCEVT
ncbi:PLP-dependent aminotransferase family protein [Serratia sp. (in: enterobacteria)]|uniref:aminotransferase-like domain-containing protein n=1 Tax=Serratia sp. (in: enterobacteria) TaxID=616 RepID=UPI003989910B